MKHKKKNKKEGVYFKTKKRLFEILEKAQPGDTASILFDDFLMILVVLNVTAVILETVPDFPSYVYQLFHVFEIFSVIIFTSEYLLRIWVITVDEKFSHSIKGRLKFITSPMGIIDLLAIFPFYFPYIIPYDLREVRALRLFKFFRLFKFGRYLESLNTFKNVLQKKREELVLTFCLLSVLLILSSSVMYYVENGAQPEVFSSIPAAMWWGIITLTTVGYGDVYPITVVGKILTTLIGMLGIGMFALPVAVLGSGFMEEVDNKKNKNKACPECGRVLHKKRGMFGKKVS